MTDNKTARSTISYLIVRDQAHENAFAKALESLGVSWGKLLPIPKTNAERFPEVKELLDQGLQSVQYTFSSDDKNQAAKLYRGASPSNDGTELSTLFMPEGVPVTIAPERREEFSPGLDAELLSLIQATAEVEMKATESVDTTAKK
jgi:Mn-containing catalase